MAEVAGPLLLLDDLLRRCLCGLRVAGHQLEPRTQLGPERHVRLVAHDVRARLLEPAEHGAALGERPERKPREGLPARQ